jgi:hypothetical protein
VSRFTLHFHDNEIENLYRTYIERKVAEYSSHLHYLGTIAVFNFLAISALYQVVDSRYEAIATPIIAIFSVLQLLLWLLRVVWIRSINRRRVGRLYIRGNRTLAKLVSFSERRIVPYLSKGFHGCIISLVVYSVPVYVLLNMSSYRFTDLVAEQYNHLMLIYHGILDCTHNQVSPKINKSLEWY